MTRLGIGRGARAWSRSAAGALALVASSFLGSCSGPPARSAAASPEAPAVTLPASSWPADRVATHILNRLAFGPSPADRAELARLGAGSWIRRQMNPARIDDGAVEARLRLLPTLTLSNAQLHAAYPRPKAAADGDAGRERDPARSPREIGRELVAQKLIRAVESRRQLQEVLTDFWFNHFNVFVGKGQDRWLLSSYERDAIRPNVFGRFRDLLEATATAPAMLFYLDNWTSTRDGFGRGRARGLNENYARELLELHTLGVDGGYTQRDVREVARCFTGWTIDRPQAAGAFLFSDAAHDQGAKTVLGHTIPAGGGRRDGETVLDLLARHPSTARFVATKLCRRFVVDDPPPALVARVAAVFLRTDGDLRSVCDAVFSSPEFWSESVPGAKTKSPLELAASAVRALGGRVDETRALAGAVGRMGEPLYQCQPPTGYKETAEPWVGAGTLLDRLRFGRTLAEGRLPGVVADPVSLAGGATAREELVDRLSAALLGRAASGSTRHAIEGALDAAPRAGRSESVQIVAGLLLGSPEFQKR